MRMLKPFFSSVATRTTLLVLMLIAAIMVVAGLWQVQKVRTIVTDEAHSQVRRSMEAAINVISGHVSNVETAVNTAAAYAQTEARHEARSYEVLHRLMDADADSVISAATLLYRDSYFPQHGRYYAPTLVRNPENGRLEENEIGGPDNDFCYLETDSNWVYTNQLDYGYWCLPYADSISTKRAMVTYSVPLHDEHDSIYAVLCADVALNWVKAIVEGAKPYDYCQAMVLSRDSMYISCPDPQWEQTINVIKHAQQFGDTSYLNLTRRMLSGVNGSDTLMKDFSLATSTGEKKKQRAIVYYAFVPHVQWSVSFAIPEEKVMDGPNRLRTFMILLLVVLLATIALVLHFVIRAQIWPLKMLAESTRLIAEGHFDVKLPIIKTHDEIRHLRDSFMEMQKSLARYIDDLQATTTSKASIESELKVANGIQMSMLPKIFPPYPERDDIEICGQLTPAKAVGGDLFDFYIRDEKLFFCIGDVSGKGVPASLVMAVTRSLFRTVSAHESAPDRIITNMNESMSDMNDTNMFVTLFIGVLDLPTGRLRYSNAGHDAPLLVGTSLEQLHVDSNIPVGVMPGWKYTSQETTLSPHTTLFLYTDGLTEAEDSQHGQFGEVRVKQVARQVMENQRQAPDLFVADMTAAVHDFVGEAEQSDDLTLLAIQYTKEHLVERIERSITLANDVQEVPRLADFVDEVCEALGFDMSVTMQMNLAIEEAVVNVMNYAYPAGHKGNVRIEAHANDMRLKFTIIDSGTPFDPTAKEEVDTTLSAEERPIGGLGIHLVRQLMDSINYERIDGKNVLTLRKKL